jgi:hypothetical protein
MRLSATSSDDLMFARMRHDVKDQAAGWKAGAKSGNTGPDYALDKGTSCAKSPIRCLFLVFDKVFARSEAFQGQPKAQIVDHQPLQFSREHVPRVADRKWRL